MSSLLDPASSYTPVYHPIQPHRSLKLTPSLSTRKAHFRRCYDIYHVALQRNDIAQAKKAYSILVRCREFDWAANWRSGLEMVNLSSSFNGEEDDHQDPSCTNGGGHDDDDNDDLTLNEERMRMRDKRLFLLKIDYLRECHIIHSRKATKKYSLREPEAILLQIVLLLASANKHAEALNELELYLPVSPYRDNALLHYYAGLLCIYLAQLEILQQDTMLSSQNLLGFVGGASSTSHGYPSYTSSQVQYGPSSSSLPSAPGVRSRSSSTSSSTTNSSNSSHSSSSDIQMTGGSKTNSLPSLSNSESQRQSSSLLSQPKKRGSRHRGQHKIIKSFNQLAHCHIKDALQISNYPTPELIKKIMQIASSGNGSMYGNDARKWFELAKRIADEKGCRFYEVDEWLGLLNGQSIEETRSIRKLELLKDVLPRSHTENASASRSSTSRRKKSARSTSSSKETARLSSTASQSHHNIGEREGDEHTFTLPPLASLPSSSRTLDSGTDNHNGARSNDGEDVDNDNDHDDDDDDEYDPFGRTRQESKKRKRHGGKMVTFASIDEAFDLSMSD